MVKTVFHHIQHAIDSQRQALLVIPWTMLLGITVLSLLPLRGPELPWVQCDKILHIGAYGCLIFSFSIFYPPERIPRLAWRLFVFSVGIEIVQSFTPYRSFDLFDMVANGSGLMLGWLALSKGYFPLVEDQGVDPYSHE